MRERAELIERARRAADYVDAQATRGNVWGTDAADLVRAVRALLAALEQGSPQPAPTTGALRPRDHAPDPNEDNADE